MKIENILQAKGRSVQTIEPEAPLAMAVHRLVASHIGALVVSSDGETVLGVLGEADVVRALSRHKAAALDQRVGDVMSKGACTTTDASVAEVMVEMTSGRHRHLPVLEHGKLVGIVSVGDLVKHRLDELHLQTAVLRDAYVAQRLSDR